MEQRLKTQWWTEKDMTIWLVQIQSLGLTVLTRLDTESDFGIAIVGFSCECGGTGRHARLKILFVYSSVGSIPTIRIMLLSFSG